jgi:hypothetical protein
VFAVVGTWVANRQLGEMREDKRAWIGIDSIPSVDRSRVSVRYGNIGKSPALVQRHVWKIDSGGNTLLDIHTAASTFEVLDKLADECPHQPVSGSITAHHMWNTTTLFPNLSGIYTETAEIGIDREQKGGLWFLGCFNYETAGLIHH